MINYEWKLISIKVDSDPERNLQSVIIQTYWEVVGTNENGLIGRFMGALPFDITQVDPNNFIPVENLNEEIVLGWIRTLVEADEKYYEHILGKIEKQIIDQIKIEYTANSFPWLSKG